MELETMRNWPYRLMIEELSPEDGGGLHAFFPTLGRGVAYGTSDSGAMSELFSSLDDGIRTYVAHMQRCGEPLPVPTAEDLEWCAAFGMVTAHLGDARSKPESDAKCAANSNHAYAA